MMNTPRTPLRPRRGGEKARSVDTKQREDTGGVIDVAEICVKCDSSVQDHDHGLQREKCDAWFHIKCEKVSIELYKALKRLVVRYGSATHVNGRSGAYWKQ